MIRLMKKVLLIPKTVEDEKRNTGQTAIADVVRFEERRQKIFGSGNETVQTSITQDEFTRALVEGNQLSLERSGLFDLPRTIAEGIGKLGSFILGSGLIGVGAGDVSGSSQADRVNADVAASLKAEDSPRSDFVVTLSPNVLTNQGTRDADDTGDDTTAQAPAAIRFDNAADAINTAANLIGASALAGVTQDDTLRFAVTSLSFIDEQTKLTSDLLSQSVAQESTLASVLTSIEGIRIATEQTAQLPLVEQLRDAGVAFPRSLEDRTNSFIPDVLNQSGINLFANFDNINRNLESLQAQIGAKPVGDEETAEAPDVPRLGFDTEVLSTLAQEGTLLSISGQMDSLIHENRRIAECTTAGHAFRAGGFVIHLASITFSTI